MKELVHPFYRSRTGITQSIDDSIAENEKD